MTAADIMETIGRAHGVTRLEMTGRSRHQRIVRARHHAMHAIRTRLRWSYPDIGRLFKRDHSTVISACDNVEDEMPVRGRA